MGALDAEIYIDVQISDSNSEFTYTKVNIPYLKKNIEVKIPNTIKEGQKIRIKNYGYFDSLGNQGDLFVIVSSVIYGEVKDIRECVKEISMQKMVIVENNDFREVNEMLQHDWKVKDFKPFKDRDFIYVYVLLEK